MIKLNNTHLEQYSKDILSNDKPTRQNARANLIRHTDSFQNVITLTEDEKKSFPKWHEINSQIKEMIASKKFPYTIDVRKSGEINDTFRSAPLLVSHEDFNNSSKPCYIVNMPHTPRLSLRDPLRYLDKQVNLLKTQGFGAKDTSSKTEADKRLAIVVGINYCHTLNTQQNKQYKRYIERAMRTLTSSHVKIFAFNWAPVWKSATGPVKRGKKGVVSQKVVKRVYRLLADANPGKAQRIFENIITCKKEIIPYQLIRNEIKNCEAVKSFYTQMKHGFANRPSFLVSWDDDAVKLRTEDNLGIFSHYDLLISKYPQLQVASTGYYMASTQEDFVEFASRADLTARRAIADTLPNGVYLPEPNLIIKISDLESLKNRISFLRKGVGKGKGLEFLGLMENMNLAKNDVKGRVVFSKKGAIQTSQSPKVKVPLKMPKTLTPTRINTAKNLASLRRFNQSVLNPKKGFAASVARAMPKGTGTATNTAKISKLYTAFDPIDYIKKIPSWNLIYYELINSLVLTYNARVNNENLKPNFCLRANRIAERAGLNADERSKIKTLLEEKSNDIWNARGLVLDNVLTDDQFFNIFIAALNANSSIYEYLISYIDNTPFVFPNLLS